MKKTSKKPVKTNNNIKVRKIVRLNDRQLKAASGGMPNNQDRDYSATAATV